jgi:CheY-like chemotaxis protein
MSPTTRASILIVEDCDPIARVIARHLESASYRTRVATDAVAAREMIAGAKPDVILLDLMMPGMSGTELLHALRSEPETADIPVILVSARVGHHGAHFRSQIDADYSVGKPFTRAQLVSAVRTVLARKQRTVDTLPLPAAPRMDGRERLAREHGLAR